MRFLLGVLFGFTLALLAFGSLAYIGPGPTPRTTLVPPVEFTPRP